MSEDYTVWDMASRIALSAVLATMLLLMVEIAAEVGALKPAHEPWVMIAAWGLLVGMAIPPVQIAAKHSYRKARDLYHSRTA